MQKKMDYHISLYWSVTNSCNFDCPQCAADRIRIKGEFAPEKIDISNMVRFLDSHNDKTFKINLSGGEPLLVENILEAALVITEKNYLGLISNLVNPGVRELGEALDPDKVIYINASAHMNELKRRNMLELFLENALYLRQKGFNVSVTEVAYPFITDKIDEYRDFFKKHGFDLLFNSFRGEWKNKQYPAAYTKDQIKAFGLDTIKIFSHDINYRKGFICNAGYNTMVVVENGDVWPCYSIKKKIGSIYGNINFRKTLLKCPYKFCTCPLPELEPQLMQKAMSETESTHKPHLLFKNHSR